MRRTVISMRSALFLVVVGLVLGLLPAAAAAPLHSGHIKIVRVSPFTIRGSGFAPGEHIVVSVKASSGALLRIDATATGTFFMRISAVRVGSCGWYSVRAI